MKKPQQNRISYFGHLPIFILLCFLSSQTFAQETFKKDFGVGTAVTVKELPSGFQLVAKVNDHYEAINTDIHGNEVSRVNLGPLGLKIIQTTDGGFVKLLEPASNMEVQKLNASGVEVWKDNFFGVFSNQKATDLIQTNEGGYMLLSTGINTLTPNHNNLLTKINSSGTVEWNSLFRNTNVGASTYFDPNKSLIIQESNVAGLYRIFADGVQKVGSNPSKSMVQTTTYKKDGSYVDQTYTSSTVNNSVFRLLDAKPDNIGGYLAMSELKNDDGAFLYPSSANPFTPVFEINNDPSIEAFQFFSIIPNSIGATVISAHFNEKVTTAAGSYTSSWSLSSAQLLGTTWKSNTPRFAIDGFQLADGRFVFTGNYGNLYLAVTTSQGEIKCPPPPYATKIGSFNGHDYYLSDDKFTWESARIASYWYGAKLVSINSEAENNFLYTHLNELAFIGLSDAHTEGNFQWENGDPVTYTNYNSSCYSCGFNDDNKDFATIMPWNGTWGFDNKWVNRKFVMEVVCDKPNEIELTSLCSNQYPEPGASWNVPVKISNNTNGGLFNKTIYLFQEYQSGIGSAPTPIKAGSFELPFMDTGQEIILDFKTTPEEIPDVNIINGIVGYQKDWGDYYFSFDSDGATKVKDLDFYCKKVSTDLSILQYDREYHLDPTYGHIYSAALFAENKGPYDAPNVRVQLMTLENITPGIDIYDYIKVYQDDAPITTWIADRKIGENTVRIEVLLDELKAGEGIEFSVAYITATNPPNEVAFNSKIKSGHVIDSDVSNNEHSLTVIKDGSNCPVNFPEFTYLGDYNGHSYFLTDFTDRWEEHLIEFEGELLNIEDQAENDFIQSVIGNEIAFIGFSDALTEGTPQWSNSNPVTFNNAQGNTSSNDYCVFNFWDGSWTYVNYWVSKKMILEVDCSTDGEAFTGSNLGAHRAITPEVEIFPNPANDFLTLRMISLKEKESEISILNAQGQILLSEKVLLPEGGFTHDFDISKLPTGLYFIKISDSATILRFSKID